MRAARMHGYKQPLVLEDVKNPEIAPDELLIKVGAAGMCRTDVQLLDGYFRSYADVEFPLTPGHEIAGTVEQIGNLVPQNANFAVGDQVVVVGGRGDGSCRHCQVGNTQICAHGNWPGFGPYGGYSEFVPMPYNYVIRIDKKYGLKAEELAPLTDAGLTPYRGVKKLRAAGVLGPDRVVGVIGAGGLGFYGVQYAKLFSAGAMVVVFARTDEKLAIAKENGADVVINTKGKSIDDIRSELVTGTGHREIDGILDCVGAEEGIQMGFNLLATSGVYSSVGLVGNRIDIPLFPLVAREFTYHGSFWGNYTDLSEVMALAQEGKLRHTVKQIRLEDANEYLDLLRDGDVVGRAVISYSESAVADTPGKPDAKVAQFA